MASAKWNADDKKSRQFEKCNWFCVCGNFCENFFVKFWDVVVVVVCDGFVQGRSGERRKRNGYIEVYITINYAIWNFCWHCKMLRENTKWMRRKQLTKWEDVNVSEYAKTLLSFLSPWHLNCCISNGFLLFASL